MKDNKIILSSFNRFMTRAEENLPRIGNIAESQNISIKLSVDKNGFIKENK